MSNTTQHGADEWYFRLTIDPLDEEEFSFPLRFEVEGDNQKALEDRAYQWLQRAKSRNRFQVRLVEKLQDGEVYAINGDVFCHEVDEERE